MNLYDQQQLIQEECIVFKQYLARPGPACSVNVHALLCYLHEHLFDETLTVNATLREVNLRSARVHAQFKRRVGMTIGIYIRTQRMAAAMWLLVHEELHVQEIAYGIGYENYQTFRRTFKRHVGVPPSEFRKRRFGRN